LRDAAPPAEAAFYRVEEVALTAPKHSDDDGTDDMFELRHPRALNPPNPAFDPVDFDRDFVSNLDEYRAGTDLAIPALNHLLARSPEAGEGGVAGTRETTERTASPTPRLPEPLCGRRPSTAPRPPGRLTALLFRPGDHGARAAASSNRVPSHGPTPSH
jgi:hypothetical protein